MKANALEQAKAAGGEDTLVVLPSTSARRLKRYREMRIPA